MAIDIKLIISAFLHSEGLPNKIHNTLILVETNPNFFVSVSDGVIELEGFEICDLLGRWELAHPTSLEDLRDTILQHCKTPISIA